MASSGAPEDREAVSNIVETVIAADRGANAQGRLASNVQQELAAILESAPFKKSKQSREFLQYIVEQTLEGNVESLKERLIGIEVFGRSANYDTSADPVVRSRATEVRKRLAQYYLSEGAHAPIRIEISPGSYLASFSNHSEPADSSSNEALDAQVSRIPVEIPVVPVALDAPSIRSTEPARFRIKRLPALLGVALLLIITIPSFWMSRRSAIDQFWQPLVVGGRPLLIYTGAVQFRSSFITPGDLAASVKVASLLSRDRESFDIRSGDDVTFDDLRQSPTVLIGCLNNQWTQFVNDDLQFGCLIDQVPMIKERSGAGRQWIPTRSSDGKLQSDYALVTRLVFSKTGQPLIAIAGINDSGTRAAAEFITNDEQVGELIKSAPKGWNKENIQFVLQTKVVNNIPSTSTVVAVRYW